MGWGEMGEDGLGEGYCC